MKRAWWWQLVVPLVIVGLVLGAILLLGNWTHDWLAGQPYTQLAWADVDCPAPPGLSREEFLSEVQYLTNMPDKLPWLDDQLSSRLREAFEKHPWVESVNGVVVRPGIVRVELTFRTPVLAVVHAGQPRAVDGQGVLLPTTADCSALPRLTVDQKAPGPSGTVWDDPRVLTAARTAAFLRPYQKALKLETVDVRDGEVSLKASAGGQVLWGHAPSQEAETEARAGEKLERLLSIVRDQGELKAGPKREHDVRPRGKPVKRTDP